jgi:zinc transport system substrate-binding protein
MRAVILPVLALALAVSACRAAVPPAHDPLDAGRIAVAVSVPPQACFVEKIGGSHVRVEVMIPPGYSHEDYSPSPRQVVALSHARLYIKVGHPAFELETRFIDPFLKNKPDVQVVDMSRGMELIQGGASEGGHEGSDPHVWVAPATVRVAARNIADALTAVDPRHAAEYQANLRSFLAEIDALDREIRALLGPAGSTGPVRRFLVYHPSWGYFAQEYGLGQIAIEAEGKEPSAKRLIELIDRARREDVRLLFVSQGFPRKSAQVIADAAGCKIVTADPQARDWAANLRRVAAEIGEAYGHG